MATATTKNKELGDDYVENYILLLKTEGKSIREILKELKGSDIVYKGKPITFYKIQTFLKNHAKKMEQKGSTEEKEKVDVKEVIAKSKVVIATLSQIAEKVEVLPEVEKVEKPKTTPSKKVDDVKELAKEEKKETPKPKIKHQESTTKEKNVSLKRKKSRSEARPQSTRELRDYLHKRR